MPSSLDIALPDLSENTDFNYNDPDNAATTGSDGFSFSGLLGMIPQAVTAYNSIKSVVSPQAGTTTAQPVTLPAPQSPVGNDSKMPAEVGTNAGFAGTIGAKLGVGAAWVWAGIALGGALFVYLIYKAIK